MTKIRLIRGPEDFHARFNVSRETLERLELYVELLRKWQKAVNLVAHSTLDEIWHRHIGDSAQIVDIVKESDSSKKSGNWLDIGSGGGFPGLVAATMLVENFDYHFHLVESNGRKCAFLSDIVRHLGLPVTVHNDRIEHLAQKERFASEDGGVSIISARALASLDSLLTLSAPFVTDVTVAYFFKGKDLQREMSLIEDQWNFQSRQYNSLTEQDGRILELSRLKRK